MSVPIEAILAKVGKWIDYADKDLALARHALAMGESCPYHLAAYHAQQCAEKYLKAYLVLNGIDFPYTHNLLRLMELCPADSPWLSGIDQAASLSSYAISARYPGDDEPVTADQAVEAIEIADRTRLILRKALITSATAAHVEDTARKIWSLPDRE